MPFSVSWTARIAWLGAGAGPMGVDSGDTITIDSEGATGGGDVTLGGTPSAADVDATIVVLAANMAVAIKAQLTQIQSFSTGGT